MSRFWSSSFVKILKLSPCFTFQINQSKRWCTLSGSSKSCIGEWGRRLNKETPSSFHVTSDTSVDLTKLANNKKIEWVSLSFYMWLWTPPCLTLFAEIINNWKFNLFTNDHQRIDAGIKEGGARVVYGKYLLMQTCIKANIDWSRHLGREGVLWQIFIDANIYWCKYLSRSRHRWRRVEYGKYLLMQHPRGEINWLCDLVTEALHIMLIHSIPFYSTMVLSFQHQPARVVILWLWCFGSFNH